MTVTINTHVYPLLYASGKTEEMNDHRRDVLSLKIEATYSEAASDFVEGAAFTIKDDSETETEYTGYGMAGPITDHRDGTVTVKMGKTNTAEQDALDEAKKANDTVNEITGGVEDISLVRAVVEAGAATLSDGEAAKVPTLSKAWEAGEYVEVGDRRYYAKTGRLYKAVQAHTTQADWTPDITPALWAVVDIDHAGTFEDPIPAAAGMEYEYGKYYLDPEDGNVYLCKRTGEAEVGKIILQYLPHDLIGQYFEVVT